jgi:hypothetical protein
MRLNGKDMFATHAVAVAEVAFTARKPFALIVAKFNVKIFRDVFG